MKFREPPVNWKQQIENLLHSYKEVYDLPGVNKDTAVAHAVQKDAIQNSMDAYDPKNPDKWTVTFELNPRHRSPFVIITDTGTYGLTGRADLDPDELSRLKYEEYLNERWRRFEALGYANPDPRARGARGQGKFVFIGASKRKEIIYETLRADGVYRVGHWITERGSKPLMDPLEGKQAKEYIKKIVSVQPLNRVGMRIIILDPVKELIEAFFPLLKCDLARYISETWWEKLLEGWEIYVKIAGHDAVRVQPPKLYKEFKGNPEKFLHRRVIRNVNINPKKFPGAKVKELVIAYSENEIPEWLQGIAVQRGGMKVTSFDITEGNEYIEPRYKRHIFGWVIFNGKAEGKLRECEDITHYGFIRTRGSIAHEILGTKGWLSREIGKFAEKELGIMPEKKMKKELKNIENHVVYYLNRLARSLGYKMPGLRGLRPSKGGGGERFPIRIELPPFEFPGVTRRVNYGEKIKGIRARIINESKNEIKVSFELTLISAARPKEVIIKPIKTLECVDEIKLASREKSDWFGPYEITFSKEEFEPGRYALKATIKALEGEQKGQELYKVTRAIYLEVNPPPGLGLFKDMKPYGFREELKKRRYQVEEEDDKLLIRYNIEHPAFKRADELKRILRKAKVKNVDPVRDYLIEIGLEVLITEDLRKEAYLLGKEKERFKKLIERDHVGVLEKTLNYWNLLHQELLFDTMKELM